MEKAGLTVTLILITAVGLARKRVVITIHAAKKTIGNAAETLMNAMKNKGFSSHPPDEPYVLQLFRAAAHLNTGLATLAKSQSRMVSFLSDKTNENISSPLWLQLNHSTLQQLEISLLIQMEVGNHWNTLISTLHDDIRLRREYRSVLSEISISIDALETAASLLFEQIIRLQFLLSVDPSTRLYKDEHQEALRLYHQIERSLHLLEHGQHLMHWLKKQINSSPSSESSQFPSEVQQARRASSLGWLQLLKFQWDSGHAASTLPPGQMNHLPQAIEQLQSVYKMYSGDPGGFDAYVQQQKPVTPKRQPTFGKVWLSPLLPYSKHFR
ncbi:hypothetical protein ABH892_004666 [Paenibacillus sp. RC254]|uniref:hypothetical protein n=2 Tax=Paenibacillus TaxID=44249 RepID=UPI0024BA3A24|nr:hypothetical protein [Paenibacillus sp. RC334]